MDQPLVSIVLPLYNGERFIRETMDSILAQTYTCWELIVVDDASTDASAEIALSYQDPRIRVIRNSRNGQVSYAHNTGNRACAGKYIASVDSDDVWKPEKLEKQVAWMETHEECSACFTQVEIINEASEPVENEELQAVFSAVNQPREAWLHSFLTTGNHLVNSSSLVRREVLEEAGDNDLCLLQLHDYDLWLRILLHHEIWLMEEPLLFYRRFGSSGSLSAAGMANSRRLYFEYSQVNGRTVREMEPDLFRRVFAEELRNPDSRSAEEILCEKVLLLASDRLVGNEVADAFLLMEQILGDPELMRLAAEKYDLTQQELYHMTAGKVYYDWATARETEHLREELKQIPVLRKQLGEVSASFRAIQDSFFWRLTGPARRLSLKAKGFLAKHDRLSMAAKTFKALLLHGPGEARKRHQELKRSAEARARLRQGFYVSERERRERQEKRYDREVCFSILVPLFNTPREYLTAMLDSVLHQSYPRWQLCLADGSDGEHAYVGDICGKLAEKDPRVCYRKLEKNGGISENTNACLEMATGGYIGLFDHDDLLHPFALSEYMDVIEAQGADMIYSDENTFHETPKDAYWPHFKPDFAPDTLRSYNYICHFTVFSRELLEKAGGGFRKAFDGSQDYDLILRLTEQAKHIVHVPKVLYYWRSHAESTASGIDAKPYVTAAARAALTEHLERTGLKGTVTDALIPSTYRIRYEIEGEPLVSIIIPNMDHAEDLRKCLTSIREKTTWRRWEVIVVENNSVEAETFDYYRELRKDDRFRVIHWKDKFNYSAINNFGAAQAAGDYLLLLNNDIEVITPEWLEEMLMFAQRKDVGAVGAMLYYPDDTVQHAGVILGIGGVAGHAHKFFPRGDYGYASRMAIAQNLSAVTAACVMIPRTVWEQVGGLDEGYAVAFNDVDLCMRIREKDLLIVWTPYAELYHYESKSRGEEDNAEKQRRFKGEIDRFMDRWSDALEAGDPYYNPNLTLLREDFSFRAEDGA